METQHSALANGLTPSESLSSKSEVQAPDVQKSIVPKGITIGLAIFALILSLAGYGFRLIAGEDFGDVARHAAVLVPAFVLGIPLLFWLGSRVLNKVKGLNIETRNALSLGWLTACIFMLWLMGSYS